MKFLNKQGQEIKLQRSKVLPGFEVKLSEDTTVDSPVNNPFFKGINFLQLPKKLKGFRNNPDLQALLEPKILNTDIQLELAENQFAVFEPNLDMTNKKLHNVNHIFGSGMFVRPSFVNFGLKNINLKKGEVIGTIIIREAII